MKGRDLKKRRMVGRQEMRDVKAKLYAHWDAFSRLEKIKLSLAFALEAALHWMIVKFGWEEESEEDHNERVRRDLQNAQSRAAVGAEFIKQTTERLRRMSAELSKADERHYAVLRVLVEWPGRSCTELEHNCWVAARRAVLEGSGDLESRPLMPSFYRNYFVVLEEQVRGCGVIAMAPDPEVSIEEAEILCTIRTEDGEEFEDIPSSVLFGTLEEAQATVAKRRLEMSGG